jgi:hypothetical protein
MFIQFYTSYIHFKINNIWSIFQWHFSYSIVDKRFSDQTIGKSFLSAWTWLLVRVDNSFSYGIISRKKNENTWKFVWRVMIINGAENFSDLTQRPSDLSVRIWPKTVARSKVVCFLAFFLQKSVHAFYVFLPGAFIILLYYSTYSVSTFFFFFF